MDPLKDLRSRLEETIGRAWQLLAEGWRELLSRSSGALTHFGSPPKNTDLLPAREDFPQWSLLAGEAWETAQSVIIRIEVPGMRKEDLDISIRGNVLVVRGVKRSEEAHEGRRYSLMERAYGNFERTIPVTHEIDRDKAEVSYRDGVLTVILPKSDPIPPRQLSIS
jgi:HSP20 family protein